MLVSGSVYDVYGMFFVVSDLTDAYLTEQIQGLESMKHFSLGFFTEGVELLTVSQGIKMPIYRAFKCHLDVARLFFVGGKKWLDLRDVAATSFVHESICSEEPRGPGFFFLFETIRFLIEKGQSQTLF